MLIIIAVPVSLFLLYIIFILYYTSIKPPKANPKSFLKKKRKKLEDSNGKKVIICIGDSITHGIYGVNYIKIVKERLKNSESNYEFINAGINGDLTVSILKRLDDIIQCKPDIAILLCGTNDLNGSQSKKRAKIYEFTKKIPKDPQFWTEKRFIDDYSKIIERLKEETKAVIAISSLPPISEEPKTKPFNDSKRFSGIIKNLATEFVVNYLPLNETMIGQLDENAPPPNFPYEKSNPISMIKFILMHYLGRSWEKISKKNGLQFLTDNLHLNKVGATFVADLVEKFLLQIDLNN
jgi:lysophospholipase L1-like esterase